MNFDPLTPLGDPHMLLRQETAIDQEAIHAVHVECFPTDSEARLVDQLRYAGRLAVSVVAEVEGEIVGHVAFSPVTLASGETGIGLAPVTVLEAYRRQEIAARLIEAGLDACREAGFGWAVVLGDPAYYARFDFRPASEFDLIDEYGGGDAFQAMELMPDGMPMGRGLVSYAPEFAVFE